MNYKKIAFAILFLILGIIAWCIAATFIYYASIFGTGIWSSPLTIEPYPTIYKGILIVGSLIISISSLIIALKGN